MQHSKGTCILYVMNSIYDTCLAELKKARDLFREPFLRARLLSQVDFHHGVHQLMRERSSELAPALEYILHLTKTCRQVLLQNMGIASWVKYHHGWTKCIVNRCDLDV